MEDETILWRSRNLHLATAEPPGLPGCFLQRACWSARGGHTCFRSDLLDREEHQTVQRYSCSLSLYTTKLPAGIGELSALFGTKNKSRFFVATYLSVLLEHAGILGQAGTGRVCLVYQLRTSAPLPCPPTGARPWDRAAFSLGKLSAAL